MRISKKTFLALLNELPFQELDLQSRFITDDEDTSATNNFIQELGRALSNVRITPSSADKPSSPKKLLSASRNLTPTLPPVEETPTKPRHPPPSTAAKELISSPHPHSSPELLPSPRTVQVAAQRRFPTNEEESIVWKRRQDMMRLAIDVDSSTAGILSEIHSVPTLVEQQVHESSESADIPDAVLHNVQWDHPPNFSRRSADDPVLKELLANTITEEQDPYASRISKQQGDNLPYVYVRGEVTNFNSESADKVIGFDSVCEIASMALWDTGCQQTIICSEYLGTELMEERIFGIMYFE